MFDRPIERPFGVMICIPNPFRRESLVRLFQNSEFECISRADPSQAIAIFRNRCLDIRVLIFDVDAFGPTFLDSLSAISNAVGYGYKPYIVALSEHTDDSQLASDLLVRHAELRAIERPLEILCTADAIRFSFSKVPFRLIHYYDHSFEGRCVPGEVPALEIRLGCRGVPLTEAPLYFADAILKYSPARSPKPISSLLQLIAMDPFYSSVLSEDSLTHRNFITNRYRIRQALLPILGSETDRLFVSELTSSGKEQVYFFRGRCLPEHIKIPLGQSGIKR